MGIAMADPRVFRIDDAPSRPLRWDRGRMFRLADPELGARHVDIHVNELKVDSGPGPYHYHSRSENAYVVLSGVVRAVIDGRVMLLRPGEAAFIPPGTKHAAGNGGQEPCRVLEVYAPPLAPDDFHILDEPVPWDGTAPEGGAAAGSELPQQTDRR